MIDQMYTAYLTALFLLCVGYVIGYIVGRTDLIYRALHILVRIAEDAAGSKPAEQAPPPAAGSTSRSRAFFVPPASEQPARARVDINETTFVTPVSTTGMERAGSGELGKTTAVQDDIGASVSRLSQLKGK